MDRSKPRRVWTVAEAKAKLSEIFVLPKRGAATYRHPEILRRRTRPPLADTTTGPQTSGTVAG